MDQILQEWVQPSHEFSTPNDITMSNDTMQQQPPPPSIQPSTSQSVQQQQQQQTSTSRPCIKFSHEMLSALVDSFSKMKETKEKW